MDRRGFFRQAAAAIAGIIAARVPIADVPSPKAFWELSTVTLHPQRLFGLVRMTEEVLADAAVLPLVISCGDLQLNIHWVKETAELT